LSEYDVRMVVLSTDDLDESIRFYTETLGMSLKFRDGAHYAALDGGSITLALATAVDHPMPGHVVVGIKTPDVDAAAVPSSRDRITTRTNAEPWSTTTRVTAWSSTVRCPSECGAAASTRRAWRGRGQVFGRQLLIVVALCGLRLEPAYADLVPRPKTC
jgi:hypothetical protein